MWTLFFLEEVYAWPEILVSNTIPGSDTTPCQPKLPLGGKTMT